ncbi:MAG: hypothetical protein Q9220_001646 [cf. Caloplaca sp. 1 TL-2023]
MAARPTTPPPLQGPSAKEKKYDRQLRLWAASGQEALENAHILLLNASPGVVGVEILKNLILPGIGSFTIVDDAEIQEEDLGINFFLTDDTLGNSRAEMTCKYLRELNPEVNGEAVTTSAESFLGESLNALDKYSIVLFIASPTQDLKLLDRVSQYCTDQAIPLVYIHSLGFYSHFSVQLPHAFPIVDTHPDPTSTQDLRLLEPWPELMRFMASQTSDLETLSDHDHGHVPYLLLLLRFLDEWKSAHNNNPPSNYKEKKEFKAFVEGQARTKNAEGGEENFDEAAAAILKSLNPSSLPSGLREIFSELDSQKPQEQPANFWLIARAIQGLYDTHGSLPLPGALPDMKAQSKDYIQLQSIYKSKARADIEDVTNRVRSLEMSFSRPKAIESKEIEAFCKGAAFVRLIKGQPLFSRFGENLEARIKPLSRMLEDESSLFPIFIAFLAWDDLYTLQNEIEDPPPIDLLNLKERSQVMISVITAAAAGDSNIGHEPEPQRTEISARVEPILEEFIRADGAELHNISALTGGMVAQEVIKVITKQYIPIDNTCVFDGIGSRTEVWRI